jgi:hypothetical protein
VADYTYTVTVEADSPEQAERVMMERVLFEEDYGFPYTISYKGPGSGFYYVHVNDGGFPSVRNDTLRPGEEAPFGYHESAIEAAELLNDGVTDRFWWQSRDFC